MIPLLSLSATVFWLAVVVTVTAGGWAAVRREWRMVAVAIMAVVLAFVVRFALVSA